MTVQASPSLAYYVFNKHVGQRKTAYEKRMEIARTTQIFTEALCQEDAALINAIKSEKKHRKIYPIMLGKALCQVSYVGRLDAVQKIMQDARFSEIEPYVLGRAFCHTVANGHTEIAKKCLQDRLFNKIPTDGVLNSLSAAIVIAVEWNRKDMVEMFMQDPFYARFLQIKDGGMIMALCKAEQHGYASIAESIRQRLQYSRQLRPGLLNGLPKIRNCFDFVVRKINSIRRLRDRYVILDGNMHV